MAGENFFWRMFSIGASAACGNGEDLEDKVKKAREAGLDERLIADAISAGKGFGNCFGECFKCFSTKEVKH